MHWWADIWNSFARFFGYDEWVWGSAGEWFAAIGTVGAIAVALYVVQREAEDRKRSQTDRFAVIVEYTTPDTDRAGSGIYSIEFSNHSDMPYPYVELLVRERSRDGRPRVIPTYPDTNGDPMNAKEHIYKLESLPLGVERAGDIVAKMCDAQGKLWYRNVVSGRYISRRRFNQWAYGVRLPARLPTWYRRL